jgi:UDP:flavonoid glycosyltransferase YjiC (YdhE family)
VRILFTCYPGFGHLHPMLPLARAAGRAGHEVAIATGPDLVPRAESYGFTTWTAGLSSAETVERYLARHPDSNALPPAERLRKVVPHMFVDIAARSRVPDLRELIRNWRPDLIVHDQSELGAPIVAAEAGIATVVHGWGPRMPAELIELTEPAVERLAAELGVHDVAEAVRDALYVDICPPGLQLPGEPAWTRIQPLRHEDPEPGPDERLPDAFDRLPHPDTVYVTLGTVVNKAPGVFEAILGGLETLDVNLIVTVGPDVDPEWLGPQPPHVVVERFIPQALVLPRCRAVVAHAGAGTMLGALARGVPQVLLPHGAEQFINAAACAQAGAALVLDPAEITPESVRAAAGRVLGDDGFTAAARRLQAEIAAMPSADEALEAVTAQAAAR